MCDILKYPEKLQNLFRLIETAKTGNPKQLAKRLQVSERTAKGWIGQLKEYDYPIVYDRQIESYKYEEGYTIIFEFKIQVKTIDKTEMAEIKGGEMENLSLIKQTEDNKFAFF